MIINHMKLQCPVTFMKCHAGGVSQIFLPKTLILNKTVFLASTSLNLVELAGSELKKKLHSV